MKRIDAEYRFTAQSAFQSNVSLNRNEPAAMTTTQPFDVRKTVDQLNLIGLTIEHDGSVSYVNPYTLRVTAWSMDEVISTLR